MCCNDVTPCVGVWIEIKVKVEGLQQAQVTPCVGVWIEIKELEKARKETKRHSLRGSVD